MSVLVPIAELGRGLSSCATMPPYRGTTHTFLELPPGIRVRVLNMIGDVYSLALPCSRAIPGGQSTDTLIWSDVAKGETYALNCCFTDLATSWCPDKHVVFNGGTYSNVSNRV